MSPNERMERGSESVFDEQESAYQQDGEGYDDEVEILVDEALYRSSEFPDEPPDEEEAQAASDDRGQHEHAEIDVEYSCGEGEDFVRYRGETGREDGPEVPLFVDAGYRIESLLAEYPRDEPMVYRIPGPEAERIGDDGAHERTGEADGRIAERFARTSEAQRYQQYIRRYRKEARFGQSENEQRGRPPRAVGPAEYPVIGPTDYIRLFYRYFGRSVIHLLFAFMYRSAKIMRRYLFNLKS